MGEVVNLRMARKRRRRADGARRADANRAAHGLTRAEREGATAERERTTRGLDGARLDEADGTDAPSDS